MPERNINKKFVLSDSSVNCYGFRLLTSGYQLAEFAKSPIGYLMHNREAGVLCKWVNLAIEGDQVTGYPVINLNYADAESIIEQINSGFYNAASMGAFVVLEATDDDSIKLANQDGPTVTKWYNRECSIVDIPGNYNALVLYDGYDNVLTLSDLKAVENGVIANKKKEEMNKIVLSAVMLSALQLSATSTEVEIEKQFADLVARASKADVLEAELKKVKETSLKMEVESIMQATLDAKKCTQATADQLKKDYATNPEGLKALVSNFAVYVPVKTQLSTAMPKKWEGKSFDELFKEEQLPQLKAQNPALYNELYQEKYGKYPN